MKNYIKPELTIEELNNCDVITTSSVEVVDGNGDGQGVDEVWPFN